MPKEYEYCVMWEAVNPFTNQWEPHYRDRFTETEKTILVDNLKPPEERRNIRVRRRRVVFGSWEDVNA